MLMAGSRGWDHNESSREELERWLCLAVKAIYLIV